jgi:hypothetical protein
VFSVVGQQFAMNSALVLVLALVLLMAVIARGDSQEIMTKKKRQSKELEQKIEKLSPLTKRSIREMKSLNMPETEIAERIKYEAGGANAAKRIVEAIGDEPKIDSKRTSFGTNYNKNEKKAQEVERNTAQKAEKKRDNYFSNKKTAEKTKKEMKGSAAKRKQREGNGQSPKKKFKRSKSHKKEL